MGSTRIITLLNCPCRTTIDLRPYRKTIAPVPIGPCPMSSNAEINFGYALWAERYVREGWTP